ncbi:MAG TPA: hypothetical protein V6C71_16630 [Coleofasciculaceae cyanobacterium]|jgi:A/G-specific adenine glycosylase
MTTEEENTKWFRDRLLTWAKCNLRNYSWRRTTDPYFILVAEFLLQRTDADTVAPIYKIFGSAKDVRIEKIAGGLGCQ